MRYFSFCVFSIGQTVFSLEKSLYWIYDALPRNEWKTWSEARGVCREKGYDLVTINDAEEENFIRQQLGS